MISLVLHNRMNGPATVLSNVVDVSVSDQGLVIGIDDKETYAKSLLRLSEGNYELGLCTEKMITVKNCTGLTAF